MDNTIQMQMKTLIKIIQIISKAIIWTVLFIVVLAIVSTLYNLTLPKESKTVTYLAPDEKVYIAEMINLISLWAIKSGRVGASNTFRFWCIMKNMRF